MQIATGLGWALVLSLAYQIGRRAAPKEGAEPGGRLRRFGFVAALNAGMAFVLMHTLAHHDEGWPWLLGTWVACGVVSLIAATNSTRD